MIDDPDETPPRGIMGATLDLLLAKCRPPDDVPTGTICPKCSIEGTPGDGMLRTEGRHVISMMVCDLCRGSGIVSRDDPRVVAFLKAYVEE